MRQITPINFFIQILLYKGKLQYLMRTIIHYAFYTIKNITIKALFNILWLFYQARNRVSIKPSFVTMRQTFLSRQLIQQLLFQNVSLFVQRSVYNNQSNCMDSYPKQQPFSTVSIFINNSINDFSELTTILKSSPSASSMNLHLKNKLLLANDADAQEIIKEMLNHFLRIVHLKGTQHLILSILAKIIGIVKLIEKIETKESLFERNQERNIIVSAIIDIILLLKNRYKQPDVTLRIIQATYSLIDEKLLTFAGYGVLTRIYSICLECCESPPAVQNISVSALFALTEIIFGNEPIKDSLVILSQMLEYLFKEKHFLWIKDKELRGIVWDLVNIAIRSFPTQHLGEVIKNKTIMTLLMHMYNTAADKAFTKEDEDEGGEGRSKILVKEEIEKSVNFKKGAFPDFLRYYKTFIYFSIHLYLRGNSELRKLIPFHDHLPDFRQLYTHPRNSKHYIFLEGVSLLIIEQSYFLIEEPQGVILIDVFNKVSEEICLSHQIFELNMESGDLYLDKMCGDFTKITLNDYAKLIKNTVLKLRKRLQFSLPNIHIELAKEENSIDESISHTISLKKRWERLIKIILKIIKNSTSLNLKEGSNEQIVRKLVGQLQYWFIICPTNKIKNLILEDLLATSYHLETRIESIRASQCLQIGSNIIYGYYDSLDTFGLATIIRMVAELTVSWQEGRGFDELEQVCIMTEKLYTEQRLVSSPESFAKTLQAFVQALNCLLADIEQPSTDAKSGKNRKRHSDRYLKIIDEILIKIKGSLEMNIPYIKNEWSFLTGFWISMGSNRRQEIRMRMMAYMLPIILFLIRQQAIGQYQIICLYQQLSKLRNNEVSKEVINHLRVILPSINREDAILEMFKVLSVMQGKGELHIQIYQMLEMIIGESLFQVRSGDKVQQIIDSISFISQDKGEEYKIVNLIWSISDHLKVLAVGCELKDQSVWKHLFGKIISLAKQTYNVETKQSCIHSLTQILAESTTILDEPLFLEIFLQLFSQIFYLLMGFSKEHQREEGENQKEIKTSNIETIRMAIKNAIKMSRKCLLINIQAVKAFFLETIFYLDLQINEKRSNMIEYLIQINVLLHYFRELSSIQSYQFQDLREQVRKLIANLQKNHSQIDKSTYTWKKYYPIFEELKTYFSQ